LESDDIFKIHKRDAIEKLIPEFRATLDNARAKVEARKGFAAGSSSRPSDDPKFGSAVIRQAIFDFNFTAILDLVVWTIAVIVSNGVMPIFILQVLQFITSAPEDRAPDYVGYLLALGLALSRLLSVIADTQRSRVTFRIFARNKHVLMPALLEKTLSLNAADFQRHSSGKIINCLEEDLGYPLVGGIAAYVHASSFATELLVNAIIMYALIGTHALVGCAAMMASTPLSAMMIKKLSKLYKEYCALKDQRIRQTNEFLQVSSCINIE
jgi:ABC-type multidrug transport system fused ATPase/permease subunit